MSGLSGEDRARLELLAEVCGQYIGGACRRALALIDQQEKALREIAEDDYPEAWGKHTATAMRDLARATLKGEDDA